MRPELVDVDGQPAVLWRPGAGWRMAAVAVLGGGIGPRSWVLNLQVPRDYGRTDPAAHVGEVAAALGLTGPGVGLLTAAKVRDARRAADGGAEVWGTVGLGLPTLAAAAPGADDVRSPGTINLVAGVPVPMSDAALLNAIATITEAKAQALADTGFDCTGTATDTVTVAAADPPAGTAPAVEFGGPRSAWGARLARAAYAVVRAGALDGWAEHRIRPVRPEPDWLTEITIHRVRGSGSIRGAEGRPDPERA